MATQITKKSKLERLKSDEESKYKLKLLPLKITCIDETCVYIIVVEDKDEHFLHLTSILSACMCERYTLGGRSSNFDFEISGLETVQTYKFQNYSPFVSSFDLCLLGDLVMKKKRKESPLFKNYCKIFEGIKSIYKENQNLPKLAKFSNYDQIETFSIDISGEKEKLVNEIDKEYSILRRMIYESDLDKEELKKMKHKVVKFLEKNEFKLFKKN